jgi:lipoyl(octanoyl) transferase
MKKRQDLMDFDQLRRHDILRMNLIDDKNADIEWILSDHPVAYPDAIDFMERRVHAIINGEAKEAVWLLEHPPLLTAGTSANNNDLIQDNGLPVFKTGRGGQYSYHGPGQRIAYVMLDLKKREKDIRLFIAALEQWLILSLAKLNIYSERREDRVGVWVKRPDKGVGYEDKIAAIGIRMRHWVSFHGISLNVEPDLAYYRSIVPCGIGSDQPHFGVTSLLDLGHIVSMPEIDTILQQSFHEIFG